MRLDLYEFETTEAAAPEGGGGEAGAAPSPETGEAAPPPAAATDTAPAAWSPAQLRDDPDFREFLAQEAADIADARFNTLLQQAGAQQQGGQQQQAQPGVDFDANEFLNPLGDNYGENMLQLLGQQQREILGAVQQMIAPLAQTHEQQTQSAGDDLLKDAIGDAITRTGDLDADDVARDRVMRDVRERFYPELAQRYGETDKAAELAIDKAVANERAYQKQIADAAVERYKNQIGTLAGVRGEPGGGAGSGVETFPDTPLSPRELALKYGGQAAAMR